MDRRRSTWEQSPVAAKSFRPCGGARAVRQRYQAQHRGERDLRAALRARPHVSSGRERLAADCFWRLAVERYHGDSHRVAVQHRVQREQPECSRAAAESGWQHHSCQTVPLASMGNTSILRHSRRCRVRRRPIRAIQIAPETWDETRSPGPGFFNIDASLFKDFAIKEGLKLQFRFETSHVLNHPSLPTRTAISRRRTRSEKLPLPTAQRVSYSLRLS